MARKYTTWIKVANAFLENKRYQVEDETHRQVGNKLKHFSRRFGPSDPKNLTTKMFRQWIRELQTTLAESTVKGIQCTCRQMLEWLNHPVAAQIKGDKIVIPEKAIRTYSDNELAKILHWCIQPHAIKGHRRSAVYLLIAATSAMRPGEIVRLKWENWNFEERVFRVMETKTKVARFSCVTRSAAIVIEEWRKECWAAGAKEWVIPSLVCPGQHVMPGSIGVRVKGLGKRLWDIKLFNTKTFRSTVARRVIESGGTYEDAAAILGHKSIETTRRFYHRIKMNHRARSAHDKAFEGL